MNKALRVLSLVLCALMLFSLTPARADMVTVGITLTGMIPDANGSFRSVTTEGSFRVYQNGQEIAVIRAGRDTLTLNNSYRIRIEPVPQSFAPEWDLSTAYLTPDVSGSGTVLIPVTVYRSSEPAAAPEPTETPVVTEAPTPEAPVIENIPAEATEVPAAEEPTEEPTPADSASAPTPTIPPYTGTDEPTPEPVPAGFAQSGTATLKVQVFLDRNRNGAQGGNGEDGIPGFTVYLLGETENVLAAAVTGADGIAVFENVPAGTYRTKTIIPDEYFFTPFSGENDLTRNAYEGTAEGEQISRPIVIEDGAEAQQGIGVNDKGAVYSGVCWLEDEVDGLYADGEPGIPGVTITMKHRDEELEYKAVSGADGSWKIAHLHPGYYVMNVVTPDGMMLTQRTDTGARARRSFLSTDTPRRWPEVNKSDDSVNLGFKWASQILGRCYLDANYNGIYDEGELPLAGVKLSTKYTFDGVEASQAVSGEDGTYVLDRMRGSSYTMTVTLPEGGYTFTRTAADNPLGNRFSARGDQRAAQVGNLKLDDAERVIIDVGVILPSSVSGTVYYDDDFSASLGGGERTVSGFQVNILDADGNLVTGDRSNAAGVYTLSGLVPGEYSLEVTAVAGYAFTKTGSGNVILNRTGGAGYSEQFRVDLGTEVTGLDIGMIQPGTVKGTVFADRNDNGLRDEGENGLTGVTVRLMSETEGEAFRAEIGEDGAFLFDAVMPGRYYVEYELPERGVFANVTEGGNAVTGEGTVGRTASFDFATGDLVEAPLCGALTLGRITGIAYQDHDGNGRMEGEETMAGMTLRLIPSRADLEEISVTTGELGMFLLDNIRPDVYQLEVTCPDGYVLSRTDYLNLPLKAGKNTQTTSLNVQMGAEWDDQKAGAVMPAAIRGQIWLDENNNGLFDEGERTPEGYSLTVIDEATGTVFDTPATDENGCFYAAGMIPGSFTVTLAMDDRTFAPKAGDSMFTEANGSLTLSGITLKENEMRDGLLMGVVRYTTLTGRAWIDRGGMIESLAGMKITMKDTAGNVIAEAETDVNGDYRMEHLMPCTFHLEMTAPEGCVIIEPDDPRLDGSLRSVALMTNNRRGASDEYELKMAVDINHMDVGCVLPGRLGDVCWVDLNGDGLQAGDEPGIPNVRIELLRDGEVIAETVTDQYGFYRFVDLYPATYVLRVYAPAEVKPTIRRTDLPMIASVLKDADSAEVLSVPITVESDRNEYNADLGFVCRVDGVLPAGAGEGETQDWTPKY